MTGHSRQVLADLHGHGAAFVLCRGGRHGFRNRNDKLPIHAGWRHIRLPVAVVEAHGPGIGIIPYSIGTSALDVDFGDIGELIDATGPLVTVETLRKGGAHAYFNDDVPRPNGKWQAYGCGGDIRSAKGYLCLYPGGAEKLASALAHTDRDDCRFPADLFAAAGMELVALPALRKPRVFKVRVPDLAPLEDVRELERGALLFDYLRFWAYAADKGDDFEAWAAACRSMAGELYRRIPVIEGQEPYELKEARATAWSVATWCWAGGGPRHHGRDHSSTAQRRRILKRWHGHGTWKGEQVIATRTTEIWRLHDAGQSGRGIAAIVGCSEPTVRRTLAAGRPSHIPVIGNPQPCFEV